MDLPDSEDEGADLPDTEGEEQNHENQDKRPNCGQTDGATKRKHRKGEGKRTVDVRLDPGWGK